MNKEILIRINDKGIAQSVYNLQNVNSLELTQLIAEIAIIHLELLGMVSKSRIKTPRGKDE